jgi:hypothetical protein
VCRVVSCRASRALTSGHAQHPYVCPTLDADFLAEKEMAVIFRAFQPKGSLKDLIYRVRTILLSLSLSRGWTVVHSHAHAHTHTRTTAHTRARAHTHTHTHATRMWIISHRRRQGADTAGSIRVWATRSTRRR